MSKPFEVVEKGLEKEVLEEYVKCGNATEIAKKYNLEYQGTIRYINWVKDNEPERLVRNSARSRIDVFQKLINLIEKVDAKIEVWGEDERKEKQWLLGVKELRESLKDYVELIDKIVTGKQMEEMKKAIFEVLNEIDPEISSKVFQKLREIKEKRGLLELN
jgi:hypothetical protein